MRELGFLFKFLLLCFALTGWSAEAKINWYQQNAQKEVRLRVDLFLTTTCPHCQAADKFFIDLQRKEPWLDVNRHLINEDKAALDLFNHYLKQQTNKVDNFAVPAIFFCNSRWVGFVDAKTTGQKLNNSLEYCRQQIEKSGRLSPRTVEVIRQWASANWYESSISGKPSAALFIPMMALIDALNPCAIFCIMTLLAFLILQQHRSRQFALAVIFLVIVSGIHYLHQIYTPTYYDILAGLRIPAIGLGFVMIGLARAARTKSGQIPDYSHHWLILIAAALAAFAIQMYQQNCTPDFSLVFQQWLMGQHYSSNKAFVYALLYQLIYFLSLGLLTLLLISGLQNRKMLKYHGIIKIFARSFLMMTGIILIVYPAGLSSLSLSFLIFALSIIAGWFYNRRHEKSIMK